MVNRLIRFSLVCIFSLFIIQLSAQTDYLAEIGVNGGGSYMLDNQNGIPFKNSKLNFGLVYRHNFNERLSVHAEWNNTKIAYQNKLSSIPNQIIGLNMFDLCGEFNYFDLIKKQYKPKSKSFSPYIFTGLGWAMTNYSSCFNIPFGVGFKYKMGNRINLNAKWAHRITLNDEIEGVISPLNGTNILNNDFISTYTIGISYDFWKRPCDCNNSFRNRNKKN